MRRERKEDRRNIVGSPYYSRRHFASSMASALSAPDVYRRAYSRFPLPPIIPSRNIVRLIKLISGTQFAGIPGSRRAGIPKSRLIAVARDTRQVRDRRSRRCGMRKIDVQ